MGPWVVEALRSLAKLTPEDPWVTESLASWEEAFDPETLAKLLGPGDQAIDFGGETLHGDVVRTTDLLGNNRYLLLEFWASWCGPCRLEIPHMKQSLRTFPGQGLRNRVLYC
ncbi:MAG: TlpA disulfide reductase family protein [Gammaproteobacteria bacterium]|nr:TlpA disulfide reductase family protein [Gammaproteobacteria bacterium]